MQVLVWVIKASDFKAQVKLQEEAIAWRRNPQMDTCLLQEKHVGLESWDLLDVFEAEIWTKIFYVYTYKICHPLDKVR